MRLSLARLAALALLCGCMSPTVAIREDFDFQKVRRVAVMGFQDFPTAKGSGTLVASLFEKALLKARYQVVERRQVDELLSESRMDLTGAVDPKVSRQLGHLLQVDALVLGQITAFTPEKRSVVYVDVSEELSEPIIEKRTRRVKRGDKWVMVERDVVTGYRTTRRNNPMPQSFIEEAQVGASVRMVDVQTGEILWVGSSHEESLNIQIAAEILAARIISGVKKTWPRAGT